MSAYRCRHRPNGISSGIFIGRHVRPAFDELIRQGAGAKVIHNDDTTMKILSVVNETRDAKRKGIFTSGMVAILDDHKLGLFFTGQKHAGENLAELLTKREAGLGPPIQMCDALSRNLPKDFITLLANCMSRGSNYIRTVALR